jgi:hypothetical protein
MKIRQIGKALPLPLAIGLILCFLLINLAYADDMSFRFDSDKTVGAFTSTWDVSGYSEIGMLTKKGSSYSIDDLQGTWYLSALTSSGPYWQRGTLTVSESSFSFVSTSSEPPQPPTSTGSVTIDSNGVLTISPSGIPDCIGHLDSGKTVAACTQSNHGNATMMIFVKKSDASYAQSDATGSWYLNSAVTGAGAPWWQRAVGTVDATGAFTGSAVFSNEPPESISTTLTVSANGTITIAESTAGCYMDAGKTVVTCTDTWVEDGSTELFIFTKKAGSYSTADLNGIWYMNGLVAPSPIWERGIITFGAGGTLIIEGTDSTGDTNYTRGTMSITADGIATLTVSCDNHPVRRDDVYNYFTVQAGCNSSTTGGQTVKVQGIELTQDPVLQNSYAINLQGGYDCEYSSIIGWSTIIGSLTVRGEAVTVDRITVQ